MTLVWPVWAGSLGCSRISTPSKRGVFGWAEFREHGRL